MKFVRKIKEYLILNVLRKNCRCGLSFLEVMAILTYFKNRPMSIHVQKIEKKIGPRLAFWLVRKIKEYFILNVLRKNCRCGLRFYEVITIFRHFANVHMSIYAKKSEKKIWSKMGYSFIVNLKEKYISKVLRKNCRCGLRFY